jgi:hypothetical protein
MWKNVLEPDRPWMTIIYGVEKMGSAYQMTKATDTHS